MNIHHSSPFFSKTPSDACVLAATPHQTDSAPMVKKWYIYKNFNFAWLWPIWLATSSPAVDVACNREFGYSLRNTVRCDLHVYFWGSGTGLTCIPKWVWLIWGLGAACMQKGVLLFFEVCGLVRLHTKELHYEEIVWVWVWVLALFASKKRVWVCFWGVGFVQTLFLVQNVLILIPQNKQTHFVCNSSSTLCLKMEQLNFFPLAEVVPNHRPV